MSFEKILYRTWQEPTLFAVLLELTYRCNLDCHFCYNDLGLEGRALSTDQWLELLEELADLEVMNLILSGGEPLAHPDFFDIGRRARDLGFVVRVKSNGHGLRGKVARRLKEEVDPYVVDVSLHGARAETHDRQTRVRGSFDRLMENLPQLQELGLRLKINATLTRWNQDEIEGMLAIADRLGVPVSLNPTVSPRDDGDQSPLALSADREAKLQLFRILAERAEGRKDSSEGEDGASEVTLSRHGDDDLPAPTVDKSCGAGSSGLTVDPYGNVLPCVQWRRPVGNLHEASISEIWEGSPALRQVRRQTVEAKKVVDGHGERGKYLNFCAGHAHSESGDPLQVYGQAREQMNLVDRVLKEREEAGEPRSEEEEKQPEGRRRELLPVIG